MSYFHQLHVLPEDEAASDESSDSFSQVSMPSRLSETSSQTSFDRESSRAPSPSLSVASMTTSMREQAYKTQYGRAINNQSDVYGLPADEEELIRLERQHIFLMDVMGGYCPPTRSILENDNSTITKAVLDLGCGSGAWIMDVARDFPHVSCVAVDLVPMQSTSMPSNCRSEVDDINLGLEHFYGQFNVVHARFIAAGIKDYRDLIRQISHVLRPGGLIELTEYDFVVRDGNKNPIRLDTASIDGPWWPRWMTFVKEALRRRGADADAADKVCGWISATGAFQDMVCRKFWLPSSPWIQGDDPQAAWWRSLGEVVREDILSFLKSGRPLLLGSGLPEEIVDILEENARNEITNCSYEYYACLQNVYAIKRHP